MIRVVRKQLEKRDRSADPGAEAIATRRAAQCILSNDTSFNFASLCSIDTS